MTSIALRLNTRLNKINKNGEVIRSYTICLNRDEQGNSGPLVAYVERPKNAGYYKKPVLVAASKLASQIEAGEFRIHSGKRHSEHAVAVGEKP